MSKLSKRWRRVLKQARRRLAGVPRAVRIAGIIVIALVMLVLSNLIYHVVHKPSELFFFVGHRLDKEPAATWRAYGPLFQTYATTSITPALLAALAQVESSGNPLDRTYWRWRFSFNPFAIYRPASSAVGLFQMTDPAYAEVSKFCIRAHAVTETGCGVMPYIRLLPSHSTELAAIYLDRNVAAILARAGRTAATPQQVQDVATIVHLCGGGPATAYARRGFKMKPDERCGDHLMSAYVARVNAFKRGFVALEADGGG